jgi:hypothetical protein
MWRLRPIVSCPVAPRYSVNPSPIVPSSPSCPRACPDSGQRVAPSPRHSPPSTTPLPISSNTPTPRHQAPADAANGRLATPPSGDSYSAVTRRVDVHPLAFRGSFAPVGNARLALRSPPPRSPPESHTIWAALTPPRQAPPRHTACLAAASMQPPALPPPLADLASTS